MAVNDGLDAQVLSELNNLLETNKTQGKNFVLIGDKGIGKSSFINGCATAVTQKAYREITRVGRFDDGSTITQSLTKFPHLGSNQRDDLDHDDKNNLVNLPNIIDVGGFPDENSPAYREIFKAILFGRIPDKGSLREAFECAGRNPEDRRPILDMFPVDAIYDKMRVHRVIFVASAIGGVPERLMELVNTVATPGGDVMDNIREVHIFLAITKKDLVTDTSNYESKKARMINLLGLRGSEDIKVFEIVNYSSDTAPERFRRNYPNLDLSFLRFLCRVSDPCFKVNNDSYNPGDPDGGRLLRRFKNAVHRAVSMAPQRVGKFCLMMTIVLLIAYQYFHWDVLLYLALGIGMLSAYCLYGN